MQLQCERCAFRPCMFKLTKPPKCSFNLNYCWFSNGIQHPAGIAPSCGDMSPTIMGKPQVEWELPALRRTLYLESNSDIPGIVHNNTNLPCVTFHMRWSFTDRNSESYTGKCPRLGNVAEIARLWALHSALWLRFLGFHFPPSSRQTPLTWAKVVFACGEAFAWGHPFQDVRVLVQHCEHSLAVQSWPLQNTIVLSTAQVKGNPSVATGFGVGMQSYAKPVTLGAIKPGALNNINWCVFEDLAEILNDPHSCGTGGLCQCDIIDSNSTSWRAGVAL